ncbi:unnamed protein product [Spirodela intermedia]|uniref:U6 snRNA phosphodiesterase n=1 Tax=Spirodela intermedia TaxID=51605 RepID=A0A7I8LP25_SPIIN|nr:unnamed protein product [Spirodela intermedia]
MEALMASYGSDSDSDDASPELSTAVAARAGTEGLRSRDIQNAPEITPLPPPPVDLLDLRSSIGYSPPLQANRVRSFPHVEGNYALHVFIPVIIPPTRRKQISSFVISIASKVPNLFAIDLDVPLDILCKENEKIEQTLGMEFHISLGRTVPIKVHQIDSIVTMLLQRLQDQRQYWIEFSRWEVFVNDDQTRTFLSLEVDGAGLSEISRQIQIINDVYRLHGLPEFYKDPRPHISLAWALGDISGALLQAARVHDRSAPNLESSQKHVFTCKFSGIKCKIGKKSYDVCRFPISR